MRNCFSIEKLFVIVLVLPWIRINNALQPPSLSESSSSRRRRSIISSIPYTVITSSINTANAVENSGLAAKLSKRDASVLKNSVFNIPPSAQTYPKFMYGQWDVSLRFSGYLFPSQSITKENIISNVNIPGFQKCSIASIADVGRELTTYRMSINQNNNNNGLLEDRVESFKSSIGAHLGYDAVDNVIYDPSSNPNRISINFVKNRTRNAERIELFCNARESELVPNPNNSNLSIFVSSEYIRQVTFSLSQEFGVARQVIGNYAHFWTWKEVEDGQSMTGNVLTACYLDPQDPMFFQEPSKPVAVYSHQISAIRVA